MSGAAPPSPNQYAGPSGGGNNFVGGGYQPFGQPHANQGGFGAPPYTGAGGQPSTGLGITGFILGLIGVIIMCCGIGPFLGIPAIICSALQQKRHKTPLAVAGLILGIIAVAIGVFFMIYWIFYFITLFAFDWDYWFYLTRMLNL